jgi:hypothetical protein
MLFVIFILGSLFAASVGFLAMMRVDSQVLNAEARDEAINTTAQTVIDLMLQRAGDRLLGTAQPNDPNNPTDVVRIPYNSYYEPSAGAVPLDSVPLNPDRMDAYAEIPGVSDLVASIEPYDSRASGTPAFDMEFFAPTRLSTLLDDRPDVYAMINGAGNVEIQPLVAFDRPLRVRRLVETAPSNSLDEWPEDYEWPGFRRDADGDGVVDSYLTPLSQLGTTYYPGRTAAFPADFPLVEPDIYSGRANLSSVNDDGDCDGIIDGPASGLPSWTVPDPGEANQNRTVVPCDDLDGDNALRKGTAIPAARLRAVVGELKDPDPSSAADDEVYFGLRVLQNGGFVNINYGHPTLVDNLLGIKPGNGVLLSSEMRSRPYQVSGHESYFRRRFLLPPRRLNYSLSLVSDMIAASPTASAPTSDLYRMLHGPADNAVFEGLVWYPLSDEPGDVGIFDESWAKTWNAPLQWNDLADSSGLGVLGYDVRHLLTTQSRDDLMLRNKANYVHLTGQPDAITWMAPGWQYYPIAPAPGPGFVNQNPSYPSAGDPACVTGITNPVYNPNNPSLACGEGYSAIDLYPGYDPQYWAFGLTTPDGDFTDPSFVRRDDAGAPFERLVPLALDAASTVNNIPYGPVVDPATGEISIHHGRMQFALHSIGNINFPTQREVQTVLDYFTVMLRNVDDLSPAGPDGLFNAPYDGDNIDNDGDNLVDENAIHDQAAMLTANLIDFADFDGAAFNGFVWDPAIVGSNLGGRNGADMPTEVLSRTGNVFYGFENQPFITELYREGTDVTAGTFAVELYNPSPVPIILDSAQNAFKLRSETGIEFDITGTIQPGAYLAFKNPNGNVTGTTTNIGGFWAEDYIELVREIPSRLNPDLGPADGRVTIVLDKFLFSAAGTDAYDGSAHANNSLNRDSLHAGGWLAPVPIAPVAPLTNPQPHEAAQTFGSASDASLNFGSFDPAFPLGPYQGWAPVHALTDSRGLESAYPTTGSLLMIMRYAHAYEPTWRNPTSSDDRRGAPFNRLLQARAKQVDNGHMPVFDQNQLAQNNWLGVANARPLDGTTQLAIPWGQLVFDYFTSLPLVDNPFNARAQLPPLTDPVPWPDLPEDPTDANIDTDNDGRVLPFDRGFNGYLDYLRSNQPTVRNGGLVVEGRININAAPWRVMQGVPMMPPSVLPIYKANLYLETPDLVGGTGYTLFAPPNLNWTALQQPAPVTGALPGPLGLAMTETAFTPTAEDPALPPGTRYAIDQLGPYKAMGAVAYRELRQIATFGIDSGNYNVLSAFAPINLDAGNPYFRRMRSDSTFGLPTTYQRHTAGFLSVGELANVRNPGTYTLGVGYTNDIRSAYQFDNGHAFGDGGGVYGSRNYLYAVAPIVALSDWVTVKGHTFTAYGVLRGGGNKEAVDARALRFEVGFDRSNLLNNPGRDERPTILYSTREPYQISGSD